MKLAQWPEIYHLSLPAVTAWHALMLGRYGDTVSCKRLAREAARLARNRVRNFPFYAAGDPPGLYRDGSGNVLRITSRVRIAAF